MAELFEILMVVCFGISWPLNIYRSYRAPTAKGKSLPFLIFIIVGYVAGIVSKLTNEGYLASFASKWYALVFYCINLVMVGIVMALYFRNVMLDKKGAEVAV